ncbi:Gti1/Pac2 family-domain-containing protein [Abortiporus biennis]|nr:Gti1/Pac2 family-domain-containing protein [Abortiporus biennis]
MSFKVPTSKRGSLSESEVFRGWVRTTKDALLVIEAARRGIIPRVTRRFHEVEKRDLIQSGAILVFTEAESGIKRWTDPFQWSSSRTLENFMIYRERDEFQVSEGSPYRRTELPPIPKVDSRDLLLERCIFGSLDKGKGLKNDGLMKKSISLTIEGVVCHLISYYRPSDIRNGILQTPSSMPLLASLEISPEVLSSVCQLHYPPRMEVDSEGKLCYA